MPKANETVTLEGTVLRKFPTEYIDGRYGKKVGKTTFILKGLDGTEHKVTKFGKIETELLGQDVRFEASYNSQYNNYTVQGEIETSELVGVGAQVDETASGVPTGVSAPTPARRGRAKKTVTNVQTPELVAPTQSPDPSASDLVRQNLVESVALLTSFGKGEPTLSEIVTVADMIGRTRVALRIEAGKDSRMANFRR